MSRLLVHVEGVTEEAFVNDILAPHLYQVNGMVVAARRLGNSRQRKKRHGIKGWNGVRDEIMDHLREDPGCYATTMVDYYGLPQSGDKAWPGRAAAEQLSVHHRALHIEAELVADLKQAMGQKFQPARFIPFIIMHEFEALLFSDCEAFSRGVGQPALQAALQAIRDAFATPEDINDSLLTAPSQRVKALIPGYQKPFLGTLAALEIGLSIMREACPHFGDWLTRLEQIVG